MIEALKKRYKLGDVITIYTDESSFTGKIEDFDESCIVIDTGDNIEFIANKSITRFSAGKFSTPVKNNEDSKEKDIEEGHVTEQIVQSIDNPDVSDLPVKENRIIKPLTEYKVGEKIPLDLLEKVSNKKSKVQKIRTPNKPTTVFKSFEDLEQLIMPEMEEENKKTVSANGVIIKYFPERTFGFIVDKFGYEIWFGLNNILDQELIETLKSPSKKYNIPILFTLSRNYKGETANLIQKPKTIDEILTNSQKLFQEDRLDSALGLIEQILYSFPDNRKALKIKSQYESKLFKIKGYVPKSKFKAYDLNYQKATRARLVDKNFEAALNFYWLALKNNEKRESCIKDIAMLYVSIGETQKALEFMLKYEVELPENITTYNYLINFYSSIKDFGKVIENLDLLLQDRLISKNALKYSGYLSRKGFALIQINRLNEAKKLLEEAVSLNHDNIYASNLLKAIDEPDKEEFGKLISEAEFETLGGGISRLMIDILENYTEYHGVPTKFVEAGQFGQKTLKEIRKLIEGAGKARPRERANYLLSEAKLMQQLEPEAEEELRSVLARYCNAMALNSIYEKYSLDIARTYYVEAFNLEDNWDSVKRQFILFVVSLKNIHQELLSVNTSLSGKEISNQVIDEIILKYLTTERREVWDNILTVFIVNKSIFSSSIKLIFKCTEVKNKTILFLRKLGFDISSDVDFDTYTNIWNFAREKRQREYSKWFASIKAIYSINSLEILVNQLSDSLQEAMKKWLPQLDISRLTTISTDIYDVLSQYLRQSGYRDKERFYSFGKAQVNQLILEIKEKPTRFSYEGFIPLLEKIDILLDKSFKVVDSASTPVVKISILGEASIVATDSSVPIKILVENSKESSPIRDISISIQNNENISTCEKAEYFDSVEGGESCEMHIKAIVSNNVIKDRATTIEVTCSYKRRNQDEPITINDQLSLRLYSEEEFEVLPNPFEKLANGGPVTDTSMFYGRNEFIERITQAIIQADSKQVVIYGQKRSGKSSVLYHLKKALENTNKTFCISFSLGDVYETLSSSTFFYKILSLIEEELENISFEHKEVPVYKCPSYSEFKENPNPADLFRKEIRIFKRTCSLMDSWKDKKLVIMIDEFTYLFTAIKTNKVSDAIMKQWKAITQNKDSMFSSVLVGQDVFPMFKDEFPNEFGVTQDERLTYLSKNDALRLIEEPIGKTKSNRNRFIGDSLDTIIEYTSCNPYYIQIFCARLVSEMNRKKYIEITSADVKEIADSFINGGQALTDDKFDNLLNAGEKHDIQRIPQDHSKAILRKIAMNAMNIGFCLREQISIGNPEYEDEILKDLVKREVLEQKGDSFKIQVKLFQEWLLKH